MTESSEGGGSDNRSESLETEFEHSTECGATDNREGTNTGRGNRRSVIPDMEVVWRSFQEEN